MKKQLKKPVDVRNFRQHISGKFAGGKGGKEGVREKKVVKGTLQKRNEDKGGKRGP